MSNVKPNSNGRGSGSNDGKQYCLGKLKEAYSRISGSRTFKNRELTQQKTPPHPHGRRVKKAFLSDLNYFNSWFKVKRHIDTLQEHFNKEYDPCFQPKGSYTSDSIATLREDETADLKHKCIEALNNWEAAALPLIIEENLGCWIFKAKILAKLGSLGFHQEYIKIYRGILDTVAKSEKVYPISFKKSAELKIFKHEVLALEPISLQEVERNRRYEPKDLLATVTYAENDERTKVMTLLSRLQSHPRRFIRLLLKLSALEASMNSDFKIIFFDPYSPNNQSPPHMTAAGSHNRKNTIFSQVSIKTITHELMHRLLNSIYLDGKKPYENEYRKELYDCVAKCVQNLYKVTNSETIPDIKSIESALHKDCKDLIERLPKVKSSMPQRLKNSISGLKEILGAGRYSDTQQPEEFIVRYISILAEYPDIESDSFFGPSSIFQPLKDYLYPYITMYMLELYDEHPNKGMLKRPLIKPLKSKL